MRSNPNNLHESYAIVAQIRALGLFAAYYDCFYCIDYLFNDYRFKGEWCDRAYYTSDPKEAIEMAIIMAKMPI